MKCTLGILIFTICLQLCYGQTDSNKIFNAKTLKKGFYKNYSEFINNNPSVTKDFDVVTLQKNKTDTTIIGGKYFVNDSAKSPSNVWGFCDGTDVYVTTINSIYVKKKYWKIKCLGPYPFFTIAVKDVLFIGPPIIALATAATTKALAAVKYELMVIDEKGRFKEPSIRLMKKWMKNQPGLLNAFVAETNKYDAYDDPTVFISDETIAARENTIKEYLFKLNDALRK